MARLLRVEEKGYLNYEELSRRLGLPPRETLRVVESLVEKELIEPRECDCGRCPPAGICPYAAGGGAWRHIG